MIQALPQEGKNLLGKLINDVLTGVTSLKNQIIARVTLLAKNNQCEILENTRPICILSCFVRLIFGIIASKLDFENFFNSVRPQTILHLMQFLGFHPQDVELIRNLRLFR